MASERGPSARSTEHRAICTIVAVMALCALLLSTNFAASANGAGEVRPCSGTSISVSFVNGDAMAVDTLFGFDAIGKVYDIPLVALVDVATFLHAEMSFDGTNGSLTAGTTVITFVVGSRKVTVDGKPVADLISAPVVYRGHPYVSSDLAARFLGTANVYDEANGYVPRGDDGKPIDVPAQCRLRPTPLQRTLIASAKMPYPMRATKTPFCADASQNELNSLDSSAIDDGPSDDTLRRRALIARAYTETCNGYYAAAYRDLSTMRAYYASDQSGGQDRPEFERRYILAASMSGHADAALALLKKSARGEVPRAYVAGDLCGAMKSFAAEDAHFPRPIDGNQAYEAHGGPGPHLQRAVDAACTGDVASAIVEMHAVTGDAKALYELMLGALYARQKEWALAGAEWWAAEGDYPGFGAMDEIAMSDPQFQSRWMLYYYRAHFEGL